MLESAILILELEDNNLKNSLKQIHTHGWNFDKQSQSQNRNLCERDLIPLLDHKSQQSEVPYFKFVNDYLLRLINNAPILDLVTIDTATSDESQQTISVDSGDNSVVAKLIKQSDRESSAQVNVTVRMFINFQGSQLLWINILRIFAVLLSRINYCKAYRDPILILIFSKMNILWTTT